MKKYENEFFKVTFLETKAERAKVDGMQPMLAIDEENLLYKTAVFSIHPALVAADPERFSGFKILSSRNLKTGLIHSVAVKVFEADDSEHPMKQPSKTIESTVEEFEEKLKSLVDEISLRPDFLKPLISDFSDCKNFKEMMKRLEVKK